MFPIIKCRVICSHIFTIEYEIKKDVNMMAALTLQEGILCEKVKRYPVLLDKKLKVYRKKDVVINAWNPEAKEIEIGRFLLFLR